MIIAQVLWIAGSLPFILLGTIHLVYTFYTNKFSPANAAVQEAMKKDHPVLTRRTTMWKAWTGFNASHSTGAIYFGIINLFLAFQYFDIIKDPVVLLINNSTVVFYLWLAKKYWFKIPFRGMLIAALCFMTGGVLMLFQ